MNYPKLSRVCKTKMIKICKNCKRKFDCYDKPKRHHIPAVKPKRQSNAVTCSHKCSVEWGYKKKK